MRLVIGGPGVSQSPLAGALFGGCLLALALSVGLHARVTRTAVGLGLLGAALLCVPVIVTRGGTALYEGSGFRSWAVVVVFVAVAEELFLRGALYDAIAELSGSTAAIIVTAAAFALLHVPLYGWHVVPLDFVVGLLLGELRHRAETPTAPAITHAGADLAAWFLR